MPECRTTHLHVPHLNEDWHSTRGKKEGRGGGRLLHALKIKIIDFTIDEPKSISNKIKMVFPENAKVCWSPSKVMDSSLIHFFHNHEQEITCTINK